MPRAWQRTLWSSIAVLALAAYLGWTLDRALWGLLIGCLLCLGWYLWELYRLERWFSNSGKAQVPTENGVWGLAYRRYLRQRNRNRKRKRKLSKFLKQFRNVYAALPDAIALLDENDHLLWFNKAAQQLLGLRTQDTDLSITMLVRHPQFVAFLNNKEEDRAPSAVDFPAPGDETRRLRARLVPYGKKQRLLIVTDISQTLHLERVRRDFVANASHELRTPLTVINGYLEALLDASPPERWHQPLTQMQQQARRMQHIIEELLMLSRLENNVQASELRPLNVADLLQAIVGEARLLSPEHRIVLEIDAKLHFTAAEAELRSAFSNLVFNAVQHTPAGSTVTVRWFADERGVHFQVSDDGEGIASHHLPRLSERFYRVDRSRKRNADSDSRRGAGLGLAIVKHVVQRHGGELRIASDLGAGSTFSCVFPLERSVVAAAENAPPLQTA